MTESTAAASYLVTGASGFIGRALCDHLLAAGATVHGVSRSAVDLDHSAYRHWCADLANAAEVDALFDEVRPRYVLHLASCVTGRRELDWIRETLAGNLRRLGRDASTTEDALLVGPASSRRPEGTTIETASDHRMAMAFAIAGLKLAGVTIDDADCVAKSNPGFWRDFSRLTTDR